MSHPMILLEPHPEHGCDLPTPNSPAARTNADPASPPPSPADAAEFEAAMAEYKRRSGRQFPTWSEVLEVLRALGYAKPDDPPALPSDVPSTRQFP
jgi:hypothetical protein